MVDMNVSIAGKAARGNSSEAKVRTLEAISAEVRRSVFETVLHAGSGHLGASSSSVELMVSLYFGGVLRYNPANPKDPNRDRVLVRGHVGPLRYKIFSMIGWLPEEELMTYRSLGSRLQGHESMELAPGVDITPSGSLGMVLSYGAGSAMAAKITGKGFRTYVFLGDGEEQEGNVSEAARHIAGLGLDNIVVILDRNRKQLSGPTSRTGSNSNIAKIWEGYGWDVKEISNANSVKEVLDMFSEVRDARRPTFIIANTIKGLGIEGAEENFCGYHTISSCSVETLTKSLERQAGVARGLGKDARSEARGAVSGIKFDQGHVSDKNLEDRPVMMSYDPGERNLDNALSSYLRKLNTEAPNLGFRLYFMAADIIKMPDLVTSGLVPPIHYLDVGIREQHLFAMAHGLAVTDSGSRVLVNTKDAFLYRCSDQLNAMAQAGTPVVIVSDDSGVSGGKNGSTHQSTGQPGLLLTMPGLRFLEPADGADLFNCLNWALTERIGPVYIRTNRVDIGDLKVESAARSLSYYRVIEPEGLPDAVIVGSGFPVVSAVAAAELLMKRDGIGVRVVNVVDMKSLDRDFVGSMLIPERPVLAVYNGNPFVLRSAIATAVMDGGAGAPSRVIGHGFELGTSGSVKDLVRHFGFDPEGIADRMRSIVRGA